MRTTELLGPQLASIAVELRATLPRLDDRNDVEGVHDFRVAIRRLRSLLRPARKVYGRFHTDHVRETLKRVADATGTLRDEEVLGETLKALTLSPENAAARDAWLQRRAPRRRGLRASLVRSVRAGEVDGALRLLDALLALPVRRGRDPDAARFAREVVFAAEAAVHAGADVPTSDITGLHALRILYKRLRYAVDGFQAALSPELSAIAPVAAKFQKRLGEVHDIDVARVSVERARTLSPSVRAALVLALDAARVVAVTRYEAERSRGVTKRDEALVSPVALPMKQSRTRGTRSSTGPGIAATRAR